MVQAGVFFVVDNNGPWSVRIDNPVLVGLPD
jgi:hypothetical protein